MSDGSGWVPVPENFYHPIKRLVPLMHEGVQIGLCAVRDDGTFDFAFNDSKYTKSIQRLLKLGDVDALSITLLEVELENE